MFYSLLSTAVQIPVHIWAIANCSPASVLKQVSDCLLAKRGKSKYLDNNTPHGSALPVPGSVSAPWTGAAAGTRPQIPPSAPRPSQQKQGDLPLPGACLTNLCLPLTCGHHRTVQISLSSQSSQKLSQCWSGCAARQAGPMGRRSTAGMSCHSSTEAGEALGVYAS